MIELFLNTQVAIAACVSALLAGLLSWIVVSHVQNKHAQALKDDMQGKLAQLQQDLALQHQANQQLSQSQQQAAQQHQDSVRSFQQEINQRDRQLSDNQRVLGQLTQQADELARVQENNQQLNDSLNTAKQAYSDLLVKHESQQASFVQERQSLEEKMQVLQDAEKQLSIQFENIANKIFEQKAEKFTKTSESGISTLIAPLKEQIDTFKRQISDQYIKEGQERASLKTEILSLQQLNKQITQEASALTNALKGDNKQQGNWGEMVLERILNESGLRNGHEYHTQLTHKDEQGKSFKPDVIVHLPNDKDIIIDSKVSLLGHEKYVNALDDIAAKQAISEHVASIKGHIKGLSKKDYQDLEGIKTLDYVLMFVPIESAFMNAVEHDPSLITLAMDNQIMLVSPTNLLVALRTINNIWQYEYQNQNAKKIADNAKKLYDKFHGFVADMEKIGKGIEGLNKHYEGAMNKLSSGRGNLIRQAEQFKTLGVTPTKSIDKKFLESDDDEEQSETLSTSAVADS